MGEDLIKDMNITTPTAPTAAAVRKVTWCPQAVQRKPPRAAPAITPIFSQNHPYIPITVL